MDKVGIVGGSGFIGSHITREFLDHNFEVKVSTTDISNKGKYVHLLKLNHADKLVIKELNVTDKTALKEFVKDCNIVIHSGTPFQLDVQDPEKELFTPTIEGTKNFLEVISNTPAVKKVVFIASVAALNTNFPLPAAGKAPGDPYSENDMPFISKESHPYAQAKFLANQAVSDFIKNNPDLNMEICSVSPVFVIGKSLSDREDSTSTGMQFLFKNKLAPNPFVQMMYDNDVEFAMVNVEDVSKAVYMAANKSGLHGKNYLLSSASYPVSDITLMLNHQEPKNKPKTIYKNQLAQEELNISFQPVKKSLNI